MTAISRRKVISTLATGSASLALAGFLNADGASGQTTVPLAKAFQGQHTPKPLAFDPAKLKGLSEKLIRSHWENNYGGAVKALNTIEFQSEDGDQQPRGGGLRRQCHHNFSCAHNRHACQWTTAHERSVQEFILLEQTRRRLEAGSRARVAIGHSDYYGKATTKIRHGPKDTGSTVCA